MMDYLLALWWLLVYEALGLPLRAALGRAAAPADVRRVLARLAGPLVPAMAIWMAGHGAAWVLHPAAGWALWAGLAWAGLRAGGAAAGRPVGWARLLAYDGGVGGGRGTWQAHGALDGGCTLLFFAFVAFRRHCPEMITTDLYGAGAEKFPNMMLFWASWFAAPLPPEDYWYAGHPLVYYYWGHWHWAWTARLAGIGPAVAINLAQARLSVAVVEAAWLLARAAGLRGAWAAGAAMAAAWGGNLAGVAVALRAAAAGAWSTLWGGYDYWAPSRAIPNVVDEFPAFTAILGDFHAHHLALPWLTAWLALLLAGERWLGRSGHAGERNLGPTSLGIWGAWAVLLAASCLANLWNLPVAGWALLLAWTARGWRRPALAWRTLNWPTAAGGTLLIAGWLLMRRGAPLPLAEASTASTLAGRLPLAWVPSALRSPAGGLWLMWGASVAALGWAALVRALHREARWALKAAGWGMLGAAGGGFALPIGMSGLASVWGAMALAVIVLAAGRRAWLPRRTVWMVAGCWAVLTALELIYLADRFDGTDLRRYNSYFKFSYPVWIPLAVAAAVAARGAWRRAPGRRGRQATVALLAMLAASILIYPLLAIPARLASIAAARSGPWTPTLDAVSFVEGFAAVRAEAPALSFIRQHVPPGAVVVEAPAAEPYRYGGRVAALAGRPVPMGWIHHETQWRGAAAFAELEARARDVDALYRAPAPELVRRQAQRLGARWVLYGVNEIRRYGPLDGPAGRVLRAAATAEHGFPSARPQVFLFEIDAGAPTIDPP